MATEWDQFGVAPEEEDWEQFKEKPLDHDFSPMNMVKNIPGSAYELGKGIYDAVRHPIDTIDMAGEVVKSGVRKGQRKIQELGYEMTEGSPLEIEPGEDEAVIDAVWEMAVNRYGGIEELQRTLEEDPVGLMADFSGVLGAASKARGFGKLGEVARMVDPASAPIALVKGAVKHLPDDAAQRVYQSAAKFPTGMRNRERVTQAALDQRIAPNKRGARKLETKLADAEARLGTLVADATQSGKLIHRGKLTQYVGDLIDAKGGVKLEGKKDQAKINKVVDELLENLDGRTMLTPDEVQRFKIDAYDKIYQRRSSPNPSKRSGVKTEAQAQIARGARHGLEEAMPEAADINKELGDLYSARGAVNQAANRIQNRNMIPARAMFGGAAAGGAAAGNPLTAAATAAIALIADSPGLKSRIAFAIDNIKKGNMGAVEKTLKNTREIRAALALADRTDEELEELGLLE